MIKLQNIPSPDQGICRDCENFNDCPMIEMLAAHRKNIKVLGKDYVEENPGLKQDVIDEPETENGHITWCPLFYKELMTAAKTHAKFAEIYEEREMKKRTTTGTELPKNVAIDAAIQSLHKLTASLDQLISRITEEDQLVKENTGPKKPRGCPSLQSVLENTPSVLGNIEAEIAERIKRLEDLLF